MSNHLAIANVTAVLKYIIYCAIAPTIHDIDINITSITPSKDPNFGKNKDSGGVNVYLYQTNFNASRRNEDLTLRNSEGRLVKKPLVPLDLYYLFTFFGDEEKLLPQRLMGSVVRALHTMPIITTDIINKTNQQSQNHYLADSGLAEQDETVKLIPLSLTLEELTKIWSVFFQTPYHLSMAYRAATVLIEGENIEPINIVEDYHIRVNPIGEKK